MVSDKMFKKLKFIEETPYKNIIKYRNDAMDIEFWTDDEVVSCDGYMDYETLKAIVRKCEDLGWHIEV